MSSRGVLFIGIVVSIIYVSLMVYFQAYYNKQGRSNDIPKFLYIQKKDNIEIISSLSYHDKSCQLIDNIDKICLKKSCSKSINFTKQKSLPNFCEFMEKLVFFITDHNLSKASVIADGKNIEINFLLNNKSQLDTLKELYHDYKNKFNINDISSVVKYFNIENIQNSINKILNTEDIEIGSDTLNFKTRKVLNKIFRKLKALGHTKIELYMDIQEDKIKILKEFIKEHYPWIDQIEIKNAKEKSIKIKEVLT